MQKGLVYLAKLFGKSGNFDLFPGLTLLVLNHDPPRNVGGGRYLPKRRAFPELVFYTFIAYSQRMKAVFVELPPFIRHRADYMDDAGFSALQKEMEDLSAREKKALKVLLERELEARR
ncbi:hypothetical protein FACS1894158_12900 [Betaproteobacteria bacterium]|nr:hypothetical protein FACS1894158_12900 [Betaproteobacteria bacterium]